MTVLRVLVVDDQMARVAAECSVLLRRTGMIPADHALPLGSADGYVVCAGFLSGQVERDDRLVNDYASIKQAIEYGLEGIRGSWSLVLLDVHFDSGRLDRNGLPEGASGDAIFGEQVYERLCQDFKGLPVVLFTTKFQRELRDTGKPYVSKENFRQEELRQTLLTHGRSSAEETRKVLSLSADVMAAAPSSLDMFNKALLHEGRNMDVMITGETGTGKEVLARYIHAQSPRCNQAFVPVNVAAIPAGLSESTLFGAEKGAYTGAHQTTKGVFELANGGTLFLDEIGDMALDIQAKVLRALQERVIRRVGGQLDIPVDVRVVTATHRPMLGYVQSGMFRKDLWSRLNTVVIEIPPLRDRPDDIQPLALGFLDRFMAEFGKKGIGLSSDALRVLTDHTFPGNVRELGNLLRLLVSEAGTNTLIAGRTVRITLEQFVWTKDGSASLPIVPDAVAESADPVRYLQELRLREFELLMEGARIDSFL